MTRASTAELRRRQRLLEAAIPLVADRGLAPGLLELAAQSSGCPLDRSRIYFSRDEDLVLALYLRLASDLEERAADLPDGKVSQRFREANGRMRLVQRHQAEALGARVVERNGRPSHFELGTRT